MSETKSIPQVLAELASKHPELVPHVEQERDWLWLVWDGRGEQNKPIRESIGRQGIGFQFAPRGHTLPSGRVANWAHHCQSPLPFRTGKRKQKQGTFGDEERLAVLS